MEYFDQWVRAGVSPKFANDLEIDLRFLQAGCTSFLFYKTGANIIQESSPVSPVLSQLSGCIFLGYKLLVYGFKLSANTTAINL